MLNIFFNNIYFTIFLAGLPKINIGQNVAFRITDVDAVEKWHDEVKNYIYERGSNGQGEILHYTQVSIAALDTLFIYCVR